MNDNAVGISTGARQSVTADGARFRDTVDDAARAIKDTVGSFVRSIRGISSREALRKTTEAASQVKQKTAEAAGGIQVYCEENTLKDLADDMAAVIRRYPRQSILVGIGVGMLVAWRRGGRLR
ncbi:MAG TPA: hypothetical protein VFU31_15940 [Candidatus Binatia bacterium]|nr:hypothetical protein [Candidatus Binatia bacterium]